jgi:hypothetical protein
MAKILFLGNFKVDYSTETHHANTLESFGHTVIRLQENNDSSDEVFRLAKDADLFIWVHTHGWETKGTLSMTDVLHTLKRLGIPTATYHLDLWFGLRRQADLETDSVYKDIEHFFTVDSKMADWFNESTNVTGHYLPAAVYDKEVSYDKQNMKRDVIFVGSKSYHPEWPYRPKLINWLEKEYRGSFELWGKDGYGTIRGNDLNNLYASTKIVVGDSLCPEFSYPDYWSDRVYETIGRGGFIIHPYITGMEKEFEDKKNIVFYEYNNFDQLKELIDYYLVHEDEREAIREAGYALVKEKYTYKNRWTYILTELGIE